MPALKLGKTFKTPVGNLPDTYYVRCFTCDRVEGQFVTATNRLLVGTGTYADGFRDRGWRFENSNWYCPDC